MEKKEIAKKEEAKDFIMAMAQVAVEKADVGTLERLVEMRRQMKEEIAREEFFKSLSMFQSELKPIKKSKVVKNRDGSIRYSYATFDDIIEAVQPLLEKYGLSYHFKTAFEDKAVIVKCIITHLAGHSEVTEFRAPVEQSGRMLPVQEWGSALTYAKRYSLSLALGLATEEDTDAILDTFPELDTENIHHNQPEEDKKGKPILNYGSKEKSPQNGFKQTREAFTGVEMISEAQKGYLVGIIKRKEWSHADAMKVICDIVGREIEKIEDLTKEEATKVITNIRKEPF